MSRRFRGGFAVVLSAFLIALLMAEWLGRVEFSHAFLRGVRAQFIDALLARSIQISIVTVLLVYFGGLLWMSVNYRKRNALHPELWKRWTAIDVCKIGLALFALTACLPMWTGGATAGSEWYSQLGIDQTTNGLVLLVGLVLSVAAERLMISGVESARRLRLICLSAIAFFLAASSFVEAAVPHVYRYKETARWTGLWVNPNVYGLLMGLGTILLVGQIAYHLNSSAQDRLAGIQKSKTPDEDPPRFFDRFLPFFICLYFFSAILCAVGLFNSYSRGAWLGTLIGMGCLLWFKVQSLKSKLRAHWILWCWTNWRPLSVLVVSIIILSFWQFHFTEWRPARRIFSIANVNDFSWRNRVTAWNGAIRMMTDRPWLGYGWKDAEPVYEKRYCPPQLENGFAIQMNDFFMLGISAGVPALVCFIVYIALTLRRRDRLREHVSRDPKLADIALSSGPDWLEASCRAGVILLLIGFWFDGGLFKLAIGPLFWTLMEFARFSSVETTEPVTPKLPESEKGLPISVGAASPPQALRDVWLRRGAWVMMALALVQTTVCVATPFLPVGKGTLAVARRWLVPPKAIGDLDFLAANIPPPDKLRILVEHSTLANYNRELINWKLPDEVYRNYVLSPAIDTHYDGQLHWRRALWEYFYPPVRKENDPQAAAMIVVKYLGDRMKLVKGESLSIEAMWRIQQANANGLNALEVAALRSVGIPSRLNENGQPELFANGKWQVAPQVNVKASDSDH